MRLVPQHHGVASHERRGVVAATHCCGAAWPLSVASRAHAQAANRAIEDVRLARENGVATVDVVLVVPRRVSRPRAGGRRRRSACGSSSRRSASRRRYRHSQRAARAAANHGGRDPPSAVRHARRPRGDRQRQGQPAAAFHGRAKVVRATSCASSSRRTTKPARSSDHPRSCRHAGARARRSVRRRPAADAPTAASRAATPKSGASATRSSSPPARMSQQRMARSAQRLPASASSTSTSTTRAAAACKSCGSDSSPTSRKRALTRPRLPAPYSNSIVVVAGVDEQDRAAALSIVQPEPQRRRCGEPQPEAARPRR